MRVFRNNFLASILLFFSIGVWSQNYQAIHGSSYAGSLSPANNPSSIVHVPYAWDVTLFAIQSKEATNAIKVKNYSLLGKATNAEVEVLNGTKKRVGYADQNIHLLNARISINSKMAIAFGVNIRGYEFLQTGTYTWKDGIATLRDFGDANISNTPLSAKTIGASWAEVYGTYAQTIKDDGNNVLNAGVTFKVDRGLAGAYATAQGINYLPNIANIGVGYLLEEGSVQYGYSSNLDDVNNNSSFRGNVKNFMRRTFSSVSVDAGMEYIMLSGTDNDYEYNTKIGVSLMDIGHVHFRHGDNSRIVIAGKNNISDSLLQNTFGSINSFNDLNDSMATVANTISALGGDFFISQPTRFIVNVDQHLSGNFFLNSELTIPVSPAAVQNKLYLKQMNLLAITPRWEKRKFGVYLPVQFNQVKQFWIGGAFKAGPLLLGIHNLANVFLKNSTQNGGFYLAVTLRPGSSHDKSSRDDDQKLSRRERKKLDCPRF
jgi:hypothetical protein